MLLRQGVEPILALEHAGAPAAAKAFVARTLTTVRHGTTLEVLASFLFGREDLIPEMFARLLPQWVDSQQARRFAYYVDRHIALDGDEHGPAGERAIAEIAGSDLDAWGAATRAAKAAIGDRIALWDAICDDLAGITQS
jgi:hypothetical protein